MHVVCSHVLPRRFELTSSTARGGGLSLADTCGYTHTHTFVNRKRSRALATTGRLRAQYTNPPVEGASSLLLRRRPVWRERAAAASEEETTTNAGAERHVRLASTCHRQWIWPRFISGLLVCVVLEVEVSHLGKEAMASALRHTHTHTHPPGTHTHTVRPGSHSSCAHGCHDNTANLRPCFFYFLR